MYGAQGPAGAPPKASGKGTKKAKKKKKVYKSSNAAENPSHAFYMGSFQLAPSDSESSSDSSSEGEIDLSESEGDKDPCCHHSRPNKRAVRGTKRGFNPRKAPEKRAKRGANRPSKPIKGRKIDALLYDTGSTEHIINDRKWFKDFEHNHGHLPVLRTGGGLITPKGVGTAEFMVRAEANKEYFTKLTLKNALYFPDVDINIVSGPRHYKAGGTLIKETLYGANRKPCGSLNVAKHGFFLELQNIGLPKSCACYSHASGNFQSPNSAPAVSDPARDSPEVHSRANLLVIEIPENTRLRGYIDFPTRASTPSPDSGDSPSGPARSESPSEPSQ